MKSPALPTFFLLLLFNFHQINLGKISDRWAKLKDDNARCSMVIADQMDENSYQLLMNFGSPIMKWLNKSNCTLEKRPFGGSNTPDENGTYNGYMGMIQRNEYDVSMQCVRVDSLAFEPGKPTAPIVAADMAIFSFKPYAEKVENRNLLSFLDLGLCVYMYLFSTCFFIAPMILAFCQSNAEERMDAFFILKRYINNCYKVLTLFMGQEQFDLAMASSYILILSMAVFSSILISGILLNTVGADLIVKRGPPVIDSLNDLLNSNMKPLMLKKLNGYALVKRAPPGTILNKLWQRMVQEGLNETVFDVPEVIDLTKTAEISLDLANKVVESESAFIGLYIDELVIRTGVCYSRSDEVFRKLGERLHISKELLAEGVITGLFSNGIHIYIEKMLDYVVKTLYETGFYLGMFHRYSPNPSELVSASFLPKYDRQLIACVEGANLLQDPTFTPFNALDLLKAFEFWAFMSCFCSLVLILEVAYYRYFPKIKVLRYFSKSKRRVGIIKTGSKTIR